MSFKPRKPDYNLKAIDPKTGETSGRIAAGWIEEDGSVTIKLDMCIRLDAKDGLTYKLFPSDFKPTKLKDN